MAIALGTKLTMAWERGGCVVHTDGMEGTCRVISVQIPCTNKRGVSLISVYVPSSEAKRETVAAVYDKLGRVRERRPGGFHTLMAEISTGRSEAAQMERNRRWDHTDTADAMKKDAWCWTAVRQKTWW